ncbi:MAG: ATP-binding protein [Hydrogenovibrio sp.]|uniref:AAA family ATPase n=1 Tax=Hydrogenovibrio sp. TaxID=2065821 RepID=UPI00287013CD|nr:ATP-binding protein [Hydrogenovibrio sp.]MDR9499932.1 ATP-binding protein [Hydrogenovibrio sp.]
MAENRHKGINVLVYGPPGTGKTQWVKLIANTLNQKLYEISAEDSEGEAVGPSNRIGLYQLTQRAFNSQKDALVLFDEVEDVFPAGTVMSFSSRGRDRVSKSWLNTLLEENPVPAFWVSNEVSQIDPAYIRRFDFVVEVPVPPRSVRLNMLEYAFDGLPVTQAWLKSLAESRVLSPALIDQVAQVVKRSTSFKQKPSCELETLILDRINATLSAQGKRKIQLKPPKPMHYSTELINTTVDMDQLVEGLKISQAGRLCLYGYPGTGKTEFGHYLSEQLDRPLVKKRASDLLSPYVGESEQNIASAFEEARNEGAILQVDEADSFLQSREDAKRSWEVTQVNELLTQMESFEGIFIATTNLVNRLDQASIRRFDWKLEFKPLTNHQAWLLFKECFGHNPKDKPQKEVQSALKQLNALTPGDFAVVSRKLKFLQSKPDASSILNMLAEEHQHKPSSQQSKGMGFLSPVV